MWTPICSMLCAFEILQWQIYPKAPWASYQIRKSVGCARARNVGNVFPATDLKGNHQLAIPACHGLPIMPWCMSGSPIRGGGENVPGNPVECATHNFTDLVRGPWTELFWQYTISQMHLSSLWSALFLKDCIETAQKRKPQRVGLRICG